ncbi:MAG: membrane protein insertase YidC [bacterium]|nr:membrane protein insertase YidC [bacterium]
MDRRTILAFVFIALIIILTPYYMKLVVGDQPVRSTPEVVDQVEKLPDAGESYERSASRPAAAPPEKQPTPQPSRQTTPPRASIAPVENFVARQVTVETDRFLATFSTRGGVLTSVRLKDYLDPLGNILELIGPGGAGFTLAHNGQSLDALEFVPDRYGLVLYGDEQSELVFRAVVGSDTFFKRFRFQGNRYRTDLQVGSDRPVPSDRLALGWSGGLADTEGDPVEHITYSMIVTRSGDEVDEWDVADLGPDGDPPPSGRVSWVGIRSKYFLAALIPPDGRYDLELEGTNPSPEHEDYQVSIRADAGDGPFSYGAYLGPISYDLLVAQNTDLSGNHRELELDEFMQYGYRLLHPIMKPITILILKAFLSLHGLIPNYGIVIIVFSILIKIVVFPMTHKSLEAAAKMQELQPKIAALREKYTDDQQKLNTEMMKLYKDQKVNPLGGCLPMLPQMPILFSLFNVFRGAIELRQSEFVMWITDLSQPDKLMVGGYEVHVLPLLMAVSSFFQSKMTMKDPKQAAMIYVMPIFMTWIFWSMSSGLVLYWTMYNLLTVVQQQVMEHTKKSLGTK